MFTGLVDDLGLITHVADTPAGRELRIRCRDTDLADGESIAVNGACLTVREHGVHDDGAGWFTVAAVITTLGRTTIDGWCAGAENDRCLKDNQSVDESGGQQRRTEGGSALHQ